MKHDPLKTWRVPVDGKVRLAEIDTGGVSALPAKHKAKAQLEIDAARIDELQNALYAERTRALLIILQGMDTSGKDGTVKSVFRFTGPLGVTVTSFQKPGPEELAHDFLWRIHASCPKRGTVGIFNRSQYEDVLVGRVRGLAPPDVIEARYDQINAFENLLVTSGMTILKIMLHISRDVQKERLQARLDTPEKRWKFDPSDLQDRELFDGYMKAYELVLQRCSTEAAPWHVVPSDHKWARNAAIGSLVRATLERMDPRYPVPDWDPADYAVT